MIDAEKYLPLLPDEIKGFVEKQLEAGMSLTSCDIHSLSDTVNVTVQLSYIEMKQPDITINIQFRKNMREM